MRNAILSIIGLFTLLLAPAGLSAQDYADAQSNGFAAPKRVVLVESWVEEWDEAAQNWVRVPDAPTQSLKPSHARAERVYAPAFRPQSALESLAEQAIPQNTGVQYGPFKVLDDKRVALVGPTDRNSPQYFDVMLADHPGLGVLEILEGPGTSDDVANLAGVHQVGRTQIAEALSYRRQAPRA